MLALALIGIIGKELQCPMNASYLTEIVFVSVIFILCTLLHLWIPERWIVVWKHIKSGLETLAIVLFIYIVFYIISCKKIIK